MGEDSDGFAPESEEIAVVAGAGDADITEEDETEDEDEDEDLEDDDDLDGFRLGQTIGLLDDDDEEDDDRAEDDREEEDDAEESELSKRGRKRVTLKGRRSMRNKAIKMRREMSWEDRFLDDPLKADQPTVEVEVPVDPYTSFYVALGELESSDALQKRKEVWTHHMQWARRNCLLPNGARVDKSFTCLTGDRMAPKGQILLIKSNSAEEVKSILESEPIQAHGGTKWSLFELGLPDEDSCEMQPVREPFAMVGKINFKNQKGELDSQLLGEHLKYHSHNRRVIFLGDLKHKGIGEDRYLVLFSAVTKKDALRYLEKDPLVLAGVLVYDSSTVGPINEQDVDGRYHMMARTFAEKAELDQLHYLDPEDIFDEELDPNLVPELDTQVKNQLFLDELRARGMSFRYDRYNYEERFQGYLSEEDAQAYNEYMGKAQTTRLEPVVDGVDGLKQFRQSSQTEDD